MFYNLLVLAAFTLIPLTGFAEIIDESEVYAINDPALTNEIRDMQSTQEAFIDAKPYDSTLFAVHEQGMTHKIRLREMMETSIFLPEKIESYVLGDSKTFKWSINKKNRSWGTIKNRLPGTDTNLILIGESGSVYSFYLRVYTLKSQHVPHLTVFIKNPDLPEKLQSETKMIKEPVAKALPQRSSDDGEYLRSLPDVDPTQINNNYFFKGGNMALAPSYIFDVGGWTYFRFGEKNLDNVRRLPTVYRVVDGYDEPVNTRVVNGTLIAETTSPEGWTLRHGTSYLCIRGSKR